jgi:hypothetical protein
MNLADLSARILLAAAATTPGTESRHTANLLYHGNWLPVTPAWRLRFPDDAAVERYVVGETETRAWLRTVDATWIHWRNGRAGPFKVYVSVQPDALPDVFACAVDVLAAEGVPAFKVSRTARGLLRPDRMVAYCTSVEQTQRLVAVLSEALHDVPPHGVAFTAPARANPAVSWARDPPPSVASYAPSWRRWVCRKHAGYLHASDASDAAGRAAWARARIRADGVDTSTWAPGRRLWAG